MSVPRAGVVIDAAASTRKVSMSMVMTRAASCRAVCVIGVHHGQGRCDLMAGGEPPIEAVSSHLHRQLSVVPLCVRGNGAGGAVALNPMSPRGIVVVHADGLPTQRLSGRVLAGSVRAWGSSTTR
jgi:hypothetical protein